MQLVFESLDPEGRQFHALAERRARFVMRRLNWLVPQASVYLTDTNGPFGGVDKRCQLELKTLGSGTVVITAMAADWRGALESALAGAARSVMRSWQRSQSRQRGKLGC